MISTFTYDEIMELYLYNKNYSQFIPIEIDSMKEGYKYTIFPSLNNKIFNDPKVKDSLNGMIPVLGDKKNSKTLFSN